ncbi:MAG: hypothetical protein JO057_20990 [Chloroflexi bacterium]|nr:hypothetical protein [Chloroflexota bacterium]
MFGSIGDVVADKDGNDDQVGLHPLDVVAQHTRLAVGAASADASVDHADVGIPTGVKLLVEEAGVVLAVGHLAAGRIAVAEDDDPELAGRFGRWHVGTDEAAAIGA